MVCLTGAITPPANWPIHGSVIRVVGALLILNRHQILAALICYRAIYYLLPLLVAIVIYLVLEWQATHKRRSR